MVVSKGSGPHGARTYGTAITHTKGARGRARKGLIMSTHTNTHVVTGAWLSGGAKHVALKLDKQANAAIKARVEAGEHVSVTFAQGDATHQVTLTGIAGYGTTKPKPRHPEGKPYMLATYAEAPEVTAQRAVKARRDNKPAANAQPQASVQASAAKATVDLTEAAKAMREAGFSAADVLAALATMGAKSTTTGEAVQAPTHQPTTRTRRSNPNRTLTDAERANRERFAQQARDRAAQRKAATASTRPTCPSCGDPMPRSYRHIAAPDVPVCGECLDLDHSVIVANIAAGDAK